MSQSNYKDYDIAVQIRAINNYQARISARNTIITHEYLRAIGYREVGQFPLTF